MTLAISTSDEKGIEAGRSPNVHKTVRIFKCARTYEEELVSYKSGRYNEVLARLRLYAEKGDALAQLTLGNIYKNGRGVAKDVSKAVYWYRKAAIQGDPDAKFNLGIMYISGHSATPDRIQAVNWLKDAAEQGHKQARCAYDYL